MAQPGASCIVVDYSCPERCGDWVEQTYPQVQVIRVPGKSHFHLAHARNLGAREANAPWLCFIDADIALASSFTEAVLPLLRPGHFYRADPCETGLVGTVLCSRADFAGIDGYDEVIQGWGARTWTSTPGWGCSDWPKPASPVSWSGHYLTTTSFG